MIRQMLAIWSLVPLPFLNPGWTSGSSLFTYCWSLAWRILSITLSQFHFWFSYIEFSFFFFHSQSNWSLTIWLIFLKVIDFLYFAPVFYFIYFCSNLYYSLPSARPGLDLFFLLLVPLFVHLGCWFRIFLLFLNASIYSCKFPVGTAFTEFCKFWYVVLSFLLIS